MRNTSYADSFESGNKYFDSFRDEMVEAINLKSDIFELATDLLLKDSLFGWMRMAGQLPGVRALLFTCNHSLLGEEAFAQFDKALLESPSKEINIYREENALTQCISILQNLEIPVIVGVRGSVIGAFLGAILAADYRIISEDTVFSFEYTKSKHAPRGALGFFLPRCVGLTKTKKILLGREPISATEALDLGLVDEIVENDIFQAKCLGIAKNMSRIPKNAVHYAKRAIHVNLYEFETFLQIQSGFIKSAADLRFPLIHDELL
jgi:2-(1,2-epoxy-1,2-dihydrophenyl)acetyl-CoA isomerase